MNSLNDNFKTIRNHIRNKFCAPNLINTCIEILHKYEKTSSPEEREQIFAKYPPYYLLFIIEITLIEGDWLAKRNFNLDQNFKKLIALYHELSNCKELNFSNKAAPSAESKISLLMRKLAFQQFYHQKTMIDKNTILRQLIMFDGIQQNSILNCCFFSVHNSINIIEYLEFLFIILTNTTNINTPFKIGNNHFRQTNNIDNDYQKKFYDLLQQMSYQIHSDTAKQELKRHLGNNFNEEKYYSMGSFFKLKPLLQLENYNFIAPSKSSLIYFMEHDLINTLQTNLDPSVFADKFSHKIFEKYCYMLLKKSEQRYLNESAIKQKYPSLNDIGQQIPDALIQENNDYIIFEFKGVVPGEGIILTNTQSTIQNKAKNNINKGIRQGDNLAEKIKENDTQSNPFLIIVTYGNYLVGQNSLLKDLLGIETEYIPLSNIFVIDILEFEHLIAHIMDGNSFTETLTAVKGYNQQQVEKMGLRGRPLFFHDSLLAVAKQPRTPEFLQKKLDSKFNELINKFFPEHHHPN
ncbi:MAG: hypothetical protein JXR42_03280 [Gammaproteobacteria bacterium]|nr:hypothetical protein [Gammaproteobacteria bacterium]